MQIRSADLGTVVSDGWRWPAFVELELPTVAAKGKGAAPKRRLPGAAGAVQIETKVPHLLTAMQERSHANLNTRI